MRLLDTMSEEDKMHNLSKISYTYGASFIALDSLINQSIEYKDTEVEDGILEEIEEVKQLLIDCTIFIHAAVGEC